MQGYYKLNNDNTIQSRSKQVDDTWLPLSELETKEDNTFATYYKLDGTIDLEKEAIQELELYKVKVKESILKAIDTMRVEVDNLAYDGNEPSQARMDRAIHTLVGDETISWRMYDNSIETITQTELGKAMRASGVLMSKLWFCASIEEVEAVVGLDPIWLDKYKDQ